MYLASSLADSEENINALVSVSKQEKIEMIYIYGAPSHCLKKMYGYTKNDFLTVTVHRFHRILIELKI